MTLVDDIRQRRIERLGYDPDDPLDQEAARREHGRQRRRDDDRDKANVNAGYRARLEEDRKRRDAERRQRAEKRRPATKKGQRRPSSRRMVRQVTAPARAQVASGMRVIGLTLAVTALYLVLTTEEERPVLSPAFTGLAGALRWLAAPDRSIPYAR